MRRNFNKVAAVALTVAMTLGSTMTAFAATSGDVSVNGTGDYEGGEIQNPDPSVTLPTVADVNYIADPNNLLANKDASGDSINTTHGTAKFDTDNTTGIFFLKKAASGDAAAEYEDTSMDYKVISKSRQDVRVTAKLEATTSGDVEFASSATFASGDVARKVYLGITDNASGDAGITAVGADGAATFTTDLAGKPDFFETGYNETDGKYEYTMMDDKSGDAGWSTATYNLKGAANMNNGVDWKSDDIEFPDIKVTWSYAVKPEDEAPSIADATYSKASGTDLVIPYSLGAGVSGADAITEVMLQFTGNTYHSINGTWGSSTQFASSFTVGANSITISKDYLAYVANGEHLLYVIYDENEDTVQGINVTIQD